MTLTNMAAISNLQVRRNSASKWTGLFAFTILVICLSASTTLRAAIQFDVFLGHDGMVPEASWFPVICEIKNDGPTFMGTIELTGANLTAGQTVRTTVELPTGTLKRLIIPVFSSSTYNSSWDLRLLDERGRMRAEQPRVTPRKQIARGTPLIGALSRTASGAPVLRQITVPSSAFQPVSARLLPSIFPDNPLVLEGLSSLYLSSERAADLSLNQVNAIFAWLHAGGHLIIGVEQPSDVTSSPWLKSLFPCDLKDLRSVDRHPQLQDWIRIATLNTNVSTPEMPQPQPNQYNNQRQGKRRYGYPATPSVQPGSQAQPADVAEFYSKIPLDLNFEAAAMQVAVGQLREGTVEVSAGETPLVVTSYRGRGRVTALMFSPEREPVRSWKNLDLFWAKLADVPPELYVAKDFNNQNGWSSDGIFGAMIDSRQVHKLPVGWLLLLLIVYLVVIGPLDQYWLKRIGKPMLTWITFPCYVVMFSLVIYFIGYKLRAGESEWNDLHIVDVLLRGEAAELRGRTYSSVYSPSNQRYTLLGQQKYATLRPEFVGGWAGNTHESDRGVVFQNGDNFKADIFVPVWASEMYVCDWWQPAPLPLTVNVTPQGDGWQVEVDNRTDKKLTNLQLVIDKLILTLGELAPNQTHTFTVAREKGMQLQNYLSMHGSGFQGVINSRRSALGQTSRGQITDLPNASAAACFLSQLYHHQYENNFISPPGLDMSHVLDQGGAVLLAWAEDYAPVKPMYQFTPKRSQRHTLWRVAVDLKGKAPRTAEKPEA
jgi:hypothetical protein